MTPTAEAMSAKAVRLFPDECLVLVEHLRDRLNAPDSTLDGLWAEEADDRLAAYRRGEIRAISLSDVLAKYQAEDNIL